MALKIAGEKEKESCMSFIEGVFVLYNIVAILDIILILKNLYGLDMKIGWKWFWIATGIYYVVSLAEVNLEIQGKVSDYTGMWLTWGYILFLVFVFSKKHRFFNVLLALPALLTYGQWTQMIALFEHLFRLDQYYFMIQESKITPLYFVQDISLLLILVYLEKKGVKEQYNTPLTLGEGIFITFFCIFFAVLVEVFEMIEEKMDSPMFAACWIVLVLAANAAAVYGIAHRKKARYYGSLSRDYRKQMDEEYEYFQEYKNKNKEIAKFRHDWNNHAMILQTMLQEGKYEEASQYFEKLSTGMAKPVRKVMTGNEILDMILSLKQDILEKENIQVDYQGKPLDLSFMEHVDICTIFSNLVDNAIESCRQVEENPYLTVKTTQNENLLMIVVENSTKETEIISEGSIPKTTKEDKKEHGFGLKNVMEIVKKYSGEMEVKQQENTFAVKMLFPKEMDAL